MNENREKNILNMKRVGRKRKRRSTDNNDVKRWSDLPNELLEAIKKRLFFADHQNLRKVCKSWSSIEEEEEKILDVPPLPQMPWVLVFDERDSCKLVDSKYKSINTIDMKSIKKKLKINSFDRMKCHESKYGWLLISSEDQKIQNPGFTTLFLYSPFLVENNNCIELPILSFDICLASFTSNPLDVDGCTVVTLNTSSQVDAIVVNTYRMGHGSWNNQVFKCDQFSLGKVKLWMYTEGMFYYVNVDGRVGTFDLAREDWNVLPVPTAMQTSLQTLLHWNTNVKIYMVKSGAELFLISERCLSGHRLHWSSYYSQYIYRLDLLSMIWEDLKSIGERVLFIGDGYNSVLNSSVLKSNGKWKRISNTIYYCSHLELKYCTVPDYTFRCSGNGRPRRQSCTRHYGSIINGCHRKLLIDPPLPLPSCPPH